MKTFAESTDRKFLSEIVKGAPQLSKAWMEFDHSIMEGESAIPLKYKKLMGIAVALTTQCPYSLEKNVEGAKNRVLRRRK